MIRQWSTVTRLIIVSITLIVVGAVFLAIRPLLGPLILSLLLAYLLLPLVRLVDTRSPLAYRGSVVVVYLTVLVLLGAAMSRLVPLLFRQAQAFPGYLATIAREIDAYVAAPRILLGREVDLAPLWGDIVEMTPDSFVIASLENAIQVLETTSLSLAWLLIILVSTFYIMLDWNRLVRWVIDLAPEEERADIRQLLDELNTIWRNYIRGMLRLMVIMSMMFVVALTIIGLPGAPTLGVLTGLLLTIPEIGAVVATLTAVVVALVQGSLFLPLPNFWFAIVVAGLYFVLLQLRVIWLQPRIMADYLKLNTGLVFVAIVGAIYLQGVLTVFVIVPLLASFGVIGRYLRCKLLNLDPWAETTPAPLPAAVLARAGGQEKTAARGAPSSTS